MKLGARGVAAGAIALLLLANLAVYLQVTGFPFTPFDDGSYVTDNQHVQGGLSLTATRWALTTGYRGFWHPVTWLSHMADVSLFGSWAGGHHLTNLLLHLAGVSALFLALRALTGSLWRSAAAAALWSLHPQRVESVAWVAERKDLLFGLFWFLGMGAYAAYARQGGAARYLAALGCFVLGLASKPMMVTFPFALLLLDGWPLGRWRPEAPLARAWPLLREKIPFLLLLLPVAAATLLGHAGQGYLRTETPWQSAGNALVSLVSYLGKTVWPAGLSLVYPAPGGSLTLVPVLLAALLLAGITALAFRVRTRLPFVPVGWAWFLVTIMPVLGLVPQGIQGYADRFTYIPQLGLFLALVWAGAEAAKAGGTLLRRGAVAALAAALLALGITSHRQAALWSDPERLFRHSLEATEGNWSMAYSLGLVLAERGRDAEAEPLFRQAIAIKPPPPAPNHHLALAHLLRRQGKGEEALEELRRTVELSRDRPWQVEREMGGLLAEMGRLEEAVAVFRQVLARAPSDLITLREAGAALVRSRRCGEALPLLLRAEAEDPGFPGLAFRLGEAYQGLGRGEEAIRAFLLAAERGEGGAEVHHRLATLWAGQGRSREAVLQLALALEMEPSREDARRDLAALLKREPGLARLIPPPLLP